MGTYTTNFALYEPSSTESVDVDSQLNYNLSISDLEFRALFEYQLFTGTSITNANVTKKNSYKWFKPYSNDSLFWRKATDGTYAAVNDKVSGAPAWADFSSSFASGFTGVGARSHSNWPYMKVITRTAGKDVSFSGKITRIDGAALTANVEVTIGTLDPAYWPVAEKLFLTYAGSSSVPATYSIARVKIKTNGDITYYRMGDTVATASDRYISLEGITYSTEVTG